MPKAREHGQGALYWVEARGMWKAVFDVGFDPDTGARLQKGRYSKTKDGAVKKLNQMLRERDSLGMVLDRSTRVRELATAWLKDVADRSRPHALANYRSHVKATSCRPWATASLLDLTPVDIRRMTAKQLIGQRVELEARRLLAYDNTPVAEIGRRLGFDEATNFAKFFAHRTGATPLDLRRTTQRSS